MAQIIIKTGGCSTKGKKIGQQFVSQSGKSILAGTFSIADEKSMIESEEKLASKIELGQSYSGMGCKLCKNKFAFRCGSCGRVVCYDGTAKSNVVCPVCGARGNVPKANGVEVPVSATTGRAKEVSAKDDQGRKDVRFITFSNVTWTKFDNVAVHASAGSYSSIEPKVHVVYNEERIEFHGYNVSEMDEGVYYMIGAKDDFSIECNVETSTIKPHPGGHLYIQLGIISAKIDLNGGSFFMNGATVATVGTKFKMKLERTGGVYAVYINGVKQGEKAVNEIDETKIVFGFAHGSHCCELLSHAYISDIKMTQCAW